MSLARSGLLALTGVVLAAVLASCTATARVTEVYMALDSNGTRVRSVFFTNAGGIFCITKAAVSRPGVTLEILIREVQAYDFKTDSFFDSERVVARGEFTPERSEGVNTFAAHYVTIDEATGMGNSDLPFAPGRLACEAYLDGELQGKTIFNVSFPECPVVEISPHLKCFGFFKEGAQCPRYGLNTPDPARCVCTVKTGWECK